MISKDIDKELKCNQTTSFECIRCGKEKIIPKYMAWKWKWGIDGKRFCSESCFMDELAHCCVCGKPISKYKFDYQHMRNQYCSKECKEKAENDYALKVGRVATCEICGKVFPNYYNNKKYCSKKCQQLAKGVKNDDRRSEKGN